MWAHIPVILPGWFVGCHLREWDNQDKSEALREHSSSWSHPWGLGWPRLAHRWREMDLGECRVQEVPCGRLAVWGFIRKMRV